MRHAKSSWTEEGKTDFERNLNKRGRRIAPQMGTFLTEQNLCPDWIISSSANRARQTAELVAESCGISDPAKIELVRYLYHAPAKEYLEAIERFYQPEVKTLMMIGHNPGLEELVFELGRLYEPMPTAAIAQFDLGDDDWIRIRRPWKARLVAIYRPKNLGFD